MDRDEQLGIQKLEYNWAVGVINEQNRENIEALERYQFVVWQADFKNQTNPLNGTLEIRDSSQMRNVMFNERNIEHQVLLRSPLEANVTDDPLITDDYECVFLQVEFELST